MSDLARAQVRPDTLFACGVGSPPRELTLSTEQLALVLELGIRPAGPVTPLPPGAQRPSMPTADLLRFLDGQAGRHERPGRYAPAYDTAPVAARAGALLGAVASPAEFAHASLASALRAACESSRKVDGSAWLPPGNAAAKGAL